MELLEVDCGNRVERGLPPLNIPPPPKPTSASLVSLPPSLPWICGWVQQWEVTCGRLWFMWRWVRVRGTWAGGGEKMDPRRDRRRQSDYSLLPPFIFIFKTRRFTRSPSPTSCRYGNLKPGEKPRVVGKRPDGRHRDGHTLRLCLWIPSSPQGNPKEERLKRVFDLPRR